MAGRQFIVYIASFLRMGAGNVGMRSERKAVMATVVVSVVLAVSILAQGAIAPAFGLKAQPYSITGYVYVDGVPTDNVTVSTNYSAGAATLTGQDSAGRHGYYILNLTASNGTALVKATYLDPQFSPAMNITANSSIENPDTALGFNTVNFFFDTSTTMMTMSPPQEKKFLAQVSDVVNNFISQITTWVKINSGESPYNNATSGAVYAHATMFDGSNATDADLTIVAANDTDLAWYRAVSDEKGVYNFTGIQNTYNIDTGDYDSSYRLKAEIYANASGQRVLLGKGVSEAFALLPGQTLNRTAVIFTQPYNITVQGPGAIATNGADYASYKAYVTDAEGRPVPDGCQIQFTLTNNNIGMGGLAPNTSNMMSGLYVIVPTYGGYASAKYGWATRTGENVVKASYMSDLVVNGSTPVKLH